MIGGNTTHPGTLPKGKGIVNNMMSIVFDPARLNAQSSFEDQTQAFVDWVQSARPDAIGKALGGILMPGDPERQMRKARADHVPIDQSTVNELAQAARIVTTINGRPVPDPATLVEN